MKIKLFMMLGLMLCGLPSLGMFQDPQRQLRDYEKKCDSQWMSEQEREIRSKQQEAICKKMMDQDTIDTMMREEIKKIRMLYNLQGQIIDL